MRPCCLATANIYLHSGLSTMVYSKMRLVRPQQISSLRSTRRQMARVTTPPLSHLIQPMCPFTTCHSCLKLQIISLKLTACQLIRHHLVAITQCKHRFLHHHSSDKLSFSCCCALVGSSSTLMPFALSPFASFRSRCSCLREANVNGAPCRPPPRRRRTSDVRI